VLTIGTVSQSTARELYAWSVGGEGHLVAPARALAPGGVEEGRLLPDLWQTFRLAAPAGPTMAVALLAPDAPLGLGGADPALPPAWSCPTATTLGASQCLVPGGAGEVALDVDAGGLLLASARYGLAAAPQPAVAAPQSETRTLAPGLVTAGQVGTRGRSHYTVTGLTPGVPVTVVLFGGTAAADLRPPTLVPPDPQEPCWLAWTSVAPIAESCTVTPAGDTLGFDVESGPLERAGAAYLLVAWTPP
jgi:hypothetical protein